jgi:4-alpha-glucanotransferase
VTVTGPLARLAEAHGVAVGYEDQLRRRIDIAADSVIAVLAALGVDASTPAAIDDALAAVARLPASPPIVVMRTNEEHLVLGVGPAVLRLGDGGRRELPGPDMLLPAGLPLGWHTVETAHGVTPLVVAPERLTRPSGRHWGWMVQLYATRSVESWGVGDLGDLADLSSWTGAHGGDVVLVNPLHAVGPTPPMQPSPYYPASRRWTNPLYLRLERSSAYLAAPPELRNQVDALRVPSDTELIDRDVAWAAKLQALHLLWVNARSKAGAVDGLEAGLRDWATWCALAEVHGSDWRAWPIGLRRPDSAQVRQARSALEDRVRFHAWLQELCSEQLSAAQLAAADAGMSIGIVHDLAVGTDPAGADAWALQDALALGARIGAPPDSFNQQGQDWGMPPWHPRRLAELGYAPLRDMVRAVLRNAGGVRIDHVLGMFRMWWVPETGTAMDGTYVAYDADAMLGVVTLEAELAGAVVIGEDLGTVTKQVRRELASRGVLGTSVMWFERESPKDGKPGRLRPLASWRQDASATVSTHDLPTALGWLRGEHVRVRSELGLLTDPAEEQRSWRVEREELVATLIALGLATADSSDEELALALHEALAVTPCRLLLAAPGDVIGDVRQPNLPGTTDEYPSWRLPIADAQGRRVFLAEVLSDPRISRVAESLARAVR